MLGIAIAQVVEVASPAIRDGTLLGILAAVLGVVFWGFKHIITVHLPKLLEDARTDARETRDHLLSLTHLQRTEFLGALAERDKLMAERDKLMAATVAKLEGQNQRVLDEICKRFEALEDLVQTRQRE